LSVSRAQLLLRKKAAEELKKEQERKAAERRRIIEERCGQPKNIDDAGEGKRSRFEIRSHSWQRTSFVIIVVTKPTRTARRRRR
jgi:hypothetical protein